MSRNSAIEASFRDLVQNKIDRRQLPITLDLLGDFLRSNRLCPSVATVGLLLNILTDHFNLVGDGTELERHAWNHSGWIDASNQISYPPEELVEALKTPVRTTFQEPTKSPGIHRRTLHGHGKNYRVPAQDVDPEDDNSDRWTMNTEVLY